MIYFAQTSGLKEQKTRKIKQLFGQHVHYSFRQSVFESYEFSLCIYHCIVPIIVLYLSLYCIYHSTVSIILLYLSFYCIYHFIVPIILLYLSLYCMIHKYLALGFRIHLIWISACGQLFCSKSRLSPTLKPQE